MINLNRYLGTWDLRRVAPKIELVNHMDSGSVQQCDMCPLMKFCARLDTKLQRSFNQIQLTYQSQRTPNRQRDALIAYNMKRVALNDSIHNKIDVDLN